MSWNDFINRPGYRKRTSYGFHNRYNMLGKLFDSFLFQNKIQLNDSISVTVQSIHCFETYTTLKVQFRKFCYRHVSMKAHKRQIRELIETNPVIKTSHNSNEFRGVTKWIGKYLLSFCEWMKIWNETIGAKVKEKINFSACWAVSDERLRKAWVPHFFVCCILTSNAQQTQRSCLRD